MEDRNIKLATLSSEEQGVLGKKYVMPEDQSNVYINGNGQPYELIGSSRVVLTLKKSSLIDGGFHRK